MRPSRLLLLVPILALAACAGSQEIAMDHDMDSHGDVTMDQMTAALEGKSGDAFDAAFLEMMIPHHQGAVDMAELAAANAKHPEIKALAEAILTSQQKEIADMQQWQSEWGYVAH
ncbi:MAG: DUF305 domain-containing protein [Candidatus Peribacteraceae bacterium]|nr:DUF305 domain-containing protein [Candidatus Peribacteraceae bacterium]